MAKTPQEQSKKQTTKARHSRKPAKQRYNATMRWAKNKDRKLAKQIRMRHRDHMQRVSRLARQAGE